MGYNQILGRSVKAVSDLVLEASTAWSDAVDEAAVGNLTPKSVLSKSMKVAQRMVTAWWSLLERGDPLLPMLYIDEVATNVPGQSPGGDVFLEEPLDTSITLAATPLQLVGGTDTLAVSTPKVVAQSGREKIHLALAVPVMTVVNPGLYVGVIHANGKAYATVTARLT
jgi:hypothetical protein